VSLSSPLVSDARPLLRKWPFISSLKYQTPWAFIVLMAFLIVQPLKADELRPIERFQKEIKPLLTQFCVNCHNAELKKGNIAFDEIDSNPSVLEDRQLWWKTLKMVRAGIMPPKMALRA